MQKKIRLITYAALIAAMYVVLTMVAAAFGLDRGVIQVRISEMLTILPVFTFAAVPGLFVGCLLANLMTGAMIWDVLIGPLATLLGAVGTWLLRKRAPYLGIVPPILSNALIVPLVLRCAYGVPDAYLYLVLTVGIGEAISAGVLGFLLYRVLCKRAGKLHRRI